VPLLTEIQPKVDACHADGTGLELHQGFLAEQEAGELEAEVTKYDDSHGAITVAEIPELDVVGNWRAPSEDERRITGSAPERYTAQDYDGTTGVRLRPDDARKNVNLEVDLLCQT
jgi:hypothetical protein